MSEQNPDAILRRKVALAAKGRTPGKTLSSALVHAIDQMFGVSVVVENIVSGLPKNHPLLLIDVPSSNRGLVALDP